MDIANIADKQREYFYKQEAYPYEVRKANLEKLYRLLKENEELFQEAMKKDLGKSYDQSYASEIGLLYKECRKFQKKLKSWMKPKRVWGTLANFPSSNYIYPSPRGSVLIIAPWNYPYLLCFDPLLGAIAGGNCAVLKPSELTPNFSEVLAQVINKNFDSKYIHVFTGGVETSQALLAQNFDHIFFTGSTQVGKIIMEAASKHLTPVTLELGGKSPCLIDKTADLDVAIKRIVWGKFMNCGQTCVAPDYILVEEDLQKQVYQKIKSTIQEFYGSNLKSSEDYGKIVSKRHLERLIKLAEESGYSKENIKYDLEERYLEPIVISDCSWTSPIMQEEIFGPILPIVPVKNLEDSLTHLKTLPPPLAFYYFGKNSHFENRILQEMRFGGGCINDTIMHLANSNLSFGGVKESGMGRYHGKKSFDAFTYEKCVVKKGLALDIPLRYPPLKNGIKFIKAIFR